MAKVENYAKNFEAMFSEFYMNLVLFLNFHVLLSKKF